MFSLPVSRDVLLYRRLLKYLMPYLRRFIIAVLCALPVAGLQGALAYLVGPLMDELLKKQDFTILYIVPVAILVGSLLQSLFQYINEYSISYIGQSITQTLRIELFDKLAEQDLAYFKKNSWNELQSRYCLDPAQLQQSITDNLQELIVKAASIVGLAGVLFYRNWLYAIVSIVILSTMIIPLSVISAKIRKMDFIARDVTVRLLNRASELALGIRQVRVFHLQDYQKSRYRHSLHELFSTSMRSIRAGLVLKPLMQMISAVGVSLVFVIGVWQIQQHQMTPGDLTSFIVAMLLLIQPLKVVGSVMSKMQRIFAPAERVFQKLDMVPIIREPENPRKIGTFQTLSFESVDFEYEPGKSVLENISLEVQAGETIALVGPSGGGKSTLVDLIPRFMDPTQGKVLCNGIDLREVSLQDLHSQISIVSQDAVIFEGSVKDNVLLGRLDATDGDLRKALEMACLWDWVATLDLGWDTQVGQFGNLLSGGQKQRLAIARAFLKNAPILVLDEATSALDNASEVIVEQALQQLLKGRTVFVIAHRLSTIRHANRIVVLEAGKITEIGTHETLLAQGGLYKTLYQLQFRHDIALGTPEKAL